MQIMNARLRFNADPESGGTVVEETPPVEPVEPIGGEGEETPGVEALGDPGKKALDAMKAERNQARQAARDAQAQLDALKAQAEGRDAEHAAEMERRKIQDEALAKANDRIRKAEVRAAAANVLADPADALKFLNLDDIEVTDEGEIDKDALQGALQELVTAKPYLAAQSGNRFQGGGDGGTRNEGNPTSQISESELSRMNPEQINQARREGRLNKVLGVN